MENDQEKILKLTMENERLKNELRKANSEIAFNQSLREMWREHLGLNSDACFQSS